MSDNMGSKAKSSQNGFYDFDTGLGKKKTSPKKQQNTSKTEFFQNSNWFMELPQTLFMIVFLVISMETKL